MAYAILRMDASDPENFSRKVLPYDVDTQARAEAAVEKYLADFEDRGFDAEQGRWWFRDEAGKPHDVWIDGVSWRDEPRIN